jgi:hypothetical protein
MDLHRFWDGVITSSSNLTRLRNEATTLRNRQEFQRSQLTELASTGFESWAQESYEIATKIAYRNGRLIGAPRDGNKDCQTVAAAPVLPPGYVVNASRIADRRMILAGTGRLICWCGFLEISDTLIEVALTPAHAHLAHTASTENGIMHRRVDNFEHDLFYWISTNSLFSCPFLIFSNLSLTVCSAS